MNFGGPLVGFMACTQKLIRQMPGRIVSRTTDVDGREAFVLTLQTREQHIRREKATSNICTNQGLLATRATIYLSLLGERGFTELARICHESAHRLAGMIAELDGYSVRYDAPFFREFVVECPIDAAEVCRRAREHDVLAGVPLERYFGESARNQLLVAVTEKHFTEDFDRMVGALRAAATE
jgi:glycine dehydrogenase subunit 1